MLLLRALAELHATHPTARLLFVGAATPATPPLLAEAARLGVRAAVAAPGRADEKGLEAAYAGADVFALPSRFEGFGLPVLEAMAHGLPVACSTAGSLPEVAGGSALTFKPGDGAALRVALETLIDDEKAAEDLGESGRARARSFTWERCARETYAVLERAAKR
jgi:alpha-1,3-rhamnosyl/mannosyltransferase